MAELFVMERSQVAEFLLHKHIKLLKLSLELENTLLNIAEYAISWKGHFSFLA
jgi:hypothetical protein